MSKPIVQHHQDARFRFHAPIWAFEKADAPAGQKRRIGGIISTDTRDRQDEVILQHGLDFSEFARAGFFNDNHSKDVSGIVGVPDPSSIKKFKKGEILPNGMAAPANGHWAEGWLLDGDPRADEIWTKIKALEKTPGDRRLGFSVEGKIERRTGADNKTIAKARIRHVAVTHAPVNTDTRLDALAKSLAAVESSEKESAVEALAEAGLFAGGDTYIGDGISPQDAEGLAARAAVGPETSELAEHVVSMDGVLDAAEGSAPPSNVVRPSNPDPRAGAVLATKGLDSVSGRALLPQSLEHKPFGKSLTFGEAISRVRARFPNMDPATAGRFVGQTILLKQRGCL